MMITHNRSVCFSGHDRVCSLKVGNNPMVGGDFEHRLRSEFDKTSRRTRRAGVACPVQISGNQLRSAFTTFDVGNTNLLSPNTNEVYPTTSLRALRFT